MEQDSILDWLMRWYEGQCDGDWEHVYGIAIDTLDNPGWSLRIDLNGTQLDGQIFERRTHKYEEEADWWSCWTEDNQFHGAGGPQQLGPMLRVFRDWVELT